MNLELFLVLLTICATLTSLITEGVKKLLDSMKVTYASNILVLAVAMVVGLSAAVLAYLQLNIPFSATNMIMGFLLACGNWLGAMVGYDKVMQAIKQIGTGGQ